jgi:exonuclease VII small subunit
MLIGGVWMLLKTSRPQTKIQPVSQSAASQQPQTVSSSSGTKATFPVSSEDLQEIINAINNGDLSVEQIKSLYETANNNIARCDRVLNLLDKTGEDNWTYDAYKEAWHIYSQGSEPDLKPSEWEQLLPEYRLQARNTFISEVYESRQDFEKIKAAIKVSAKIGEKEKNEWTVTDWIIALEELPIVSSSRVPKCSHSQSDTEFDGNDYTDPSALAKDLVNKWASIHDNHITWNVYESTYSEERSIYQIAKSTWRLVTKTEYRD